jgi:LuxR family maltose regulon positive regulatory protein
MTAMAMTFSLHENLELGGTDSPLEIFPAPSQSRAVQKTDEIHLFREKMAIPVFENYVARPRLNELLEKTLHQFGAALITGRTGTGKTALAADFSGKYKRVAWFSVESAENDWEVFFRYFLESFSPILNEKQKQEVVSEIEKTKPQTVAPFIENLLSRVELPREEKPFLIVIDGVHNVFDAGWFSEFFTTLLYALTPDVHLVMLSRSNPPLPLWRLRSKQVLGVIDEKLLAFTLLETQELFEKFDSPEEKIFQAFGKTFGRISRLKEFIDKLG